MEKLELKHLAPYLPYELQWHFEGEETWEGKAKLHEVVGLFACYDGVQLHSDDDGVAHVEYSAGKPVLRPLSDLIVERDGKIDLVELAKIANDDIGGKDVYEWFLWDEVKVKVSGFNGVTYSVYHGTYEEELFFRFNTKNFYFVKHDDDDLEMGCINMEKVFEYFFQNHYDVHGLIEAGLAIDINTLEL